MSLKQLQQMVSRLAKQAFDQESFMSSSLSVKSYKAAENFTSDQCLISMGNFLAQKAKKSPFITRAELLDAYHKLHTSNTKFAELFAEELGVVAKVEVPKMKRDVNEGFVEKSHSYADPALLAALESVIDKKAQTPYKPYSGEMANKVIKSCAMELGNHNLKPKEIKVVAGQSDLLLCQATWETPKGKASVLIPVEIKEGSALLPNMFLAGEGFVDLSQEAMEGHLLRTAGKSYKVDVNKILGVLSQVKNGGESLSDVEALVIRATLGDKQDYLVESFSFGEIDPKVEKVIDPRYASEESMLFGAKLSSMVGGAEFTLGKVAVDGGKKIILRAMKDFGYDHVQVGVANFGEGKITYAVSVGRNGFKVPVNVEKGAAISPKVILSVNGIKAFDRNGVNEILSGEVDSGSIALASRMSMDKPSQLVERVKLAMIEEDSNKAEEALNVLKASGDNKAFTIATRIYLDGLKGDIKVEASGCKMQRKIANSTHEVCGHTNLPLNKVYQDSMGQCQPLYRKAMSESNDGGVFMAHKIFWNEE